MLRFRIGLQPALNLVMRFARPANFSKYTAISSKIAKTRATVETLLKSLYNAHKSLIAETAFWRVTGRMERGRCSEARRKDATFAVLEELQSRIMKWKDGGVDRWGRKVHEATGRR